MTAPADAERLAAREASICYGHDLSLRRGEAECDTCFIISRLRDARGEIARQRTLLDEREAEVARLREKQFCMPDLRAAAKAAAELLNQGAIPEAIASLLKLAAGDDQDAQSSREVALTEAAAWHEERQAYCYAQVDCGEGNPIILGAHAAAHGDAAAHFRSLITKGGADAPVAGPTGGIDRRPGYDVGDGTVKEGDTAMYLGMPCKVLTVYHDGDVQIEVSTFPTVKWRQVAPLPDSTPTQDTPPDAG